jgi:hypothetical protein
MKTIRSMISRSCLISWNKSKTMKSYTEIFLIARVSYQGLSNPSGKKQLARRVICRNWLEWRVFSTKKAAEMMTILMTSSFWARLSEYYLRIVSSPTKNEILCCLAKVEQARIYLSLSWCKIFSKTVILTTIWYSFTNLQNCLVKKAQRNSSVNSKSI